MLPDAAAVRGELLVLVAGEGHARLEYGEVPLELGPVVRGHQHHGHRGRLEHEAIPRRCRRHRRSRAGRRASAATAPPSAGPCRR